MSDIVERLRGRINDAPLPSEYLMDEAADTIASLTAEVERWKKASAQHLADAALASAKLASAQAQVERLRAALAPFAEQMKRFDESQAMDSAPVGWGGLTIGDLRRARVALQSTEGEWRPDPKTVEAAAKLCEKEADACIRDIVPGDDIGAKQAHARAGALLTAAGDIRSLSDHPSAEKE